MYVPLSIIGLKVVLEGTCYSAPFMKSNRICPCRFFRPRFQQRKKPLCTKSLSSFVKNWKWVGPIYTDREALTFPTIKVNEYPQYSHTLIDATDSPWSRSIKVRDAPPRDFVSFTATTSITLSTEAAKVLVFEFMKSCYLCELSFLFQTPVDPYELSPFYES